MIGLHRAALVALILTASTMVTAHADEAGDKAAITERLQRWTADFNSSDALGVCDLFAPDLNLFNSGGRAGNARNPLCKLDGHLG